MNQKIEAIASRAVIQARDIFDLYVLSSQYENLKTARFEQINNVKDSKLQKAVVSYLPTEEQSVYNTLSSWDEIKLKTVNFIEELRKDKKYV